MNLKKPRAGVFMRFLKVYYISIKTKAWEFEFSWQFFFAKFVKIEPTLYVKLSDATRLTKSGIAGGILLLLQQLERNTGLEGVAACQEKRYKCLEITRLMKHISAMKNCNKTILA